MALLIMLQICKNMSSPCTKIRSKCRISLKKYPFFHLFGLTHYLNSQYKFQCDKWGLRSKATKVILEDTCGNTPDVYKPLVCHWYPGTIKPLACCCGHHTFSKSAEVKVTGRDTRSVKRLFVLPIVQTWKTQSRSAICYYYSIFLEL